MDATARKSDGPGLDLVFADHEEPLFRIGEQVRVLNRMTVGHYRVPGYIRGKTGLVEAVIEPRGVNNEDEGFGRNAGTKLHYYRVGFPLTEVFAGRAEASRDTLRIEIYETWLERTLP